MLNKFPIMVINHMFMSNFSIEFLFFNPIQNDTL